MNITAFALLACVLSAPVALARQTTPVEEANPVSGSPTLLGDFGVSLAVQRDTMVVGAYREHPSGVSEAGRVYVLRRGPLGWPSVPQESFDAPTLASGERFGLECDVDGDVFVATAIAHDGGGLTSSGGAWVYTRPHPGAPFGATPQALFASDRDAGDQFGYHVSIDGDRMAIGAAGADYLALSDAGAVYVFELQAGVWVETAIVTAAVPAVDDHFGASLALEGERLLVGVPQESGGTAIGRALVFERIAGLWTEVAELVTGDTLLSDVYGAKVALDGDRALVGAKWHDHSGLTDAGAAYLFERQPSGTWPLAEKLVASDASNFDRFGEDVALDRGLALAGASFDYPTGDGDNWGEGAAYLFQRSGSGAYGPTEWQKLTPANAGSSAGDRFGYKVAVDCGTILVSSFGDWINGLQHAGSVFVFGWGQTGIGTSYCGPAVMNSSGASAEIAAHGSPVVAHEQLCLSARSLPANQFGYFLLSETQGFVSGPGGSQGNLCLGGTIGRFVKAVASSGAAGRLALRVDVNDLPKPLAPAIQPGETWNFQAWFRDKNPQQTSNFTDATSVVFE